MHGKVAVVTTSTDATVSTREYQDFLHDLIEEVLFAEQEKVKRDEIKHASYVMTKIRLEGLIFDFFKTKPLHKINAEVLTEFITFLTQKILLLQPFKVTWRKRESYSSCCAEKVSFKQCLLFRR